MSGIHDLTEKDLQIGCLSLGKLEFKIVIKYSNTKMKIVIFCSTTKFAAGEINMRHIN